MFRGKLTHEKLKSKKLKIISSRNNTQGQAQSWKKYFADKVNESKNLKYRKLLHKNSSEYPLPLLSACIFPIQLMNINDLLSFQAKWTNSQMLSPCPCTNPSWKAPLKTTEHAFADPFLSGLVTSTDSMECTRPWCLCYKPSQHSTPFLGPSSFAHVYWFGLSQS